MDIVILIVIAGCALAGLGWGGLRIISVVFGVAAAVMAGRWVGPVAAIWLGGEKPAPGHLIAATIIAGIIAGGLVLLAGRGLRRSLEALHLGFLDRLAGMLLAGATATILASLLLALATMGGHPPTAPVAQRLSTWGQVLLAHRAKTNSNANPTSPTSTPSPPKIQGEQPKG